MNFDTCQVLCIIEFRETLTLRDVKDVDAIGVAIDWIQVFNGIIVRVMEGIVPEREEGVDADYEKDEEKVVSVADRGLVSVNDKAFFVVFQEVKDVLCKSCDPRMKTIAPAFYTEESKYGGQYNE